MKSIAGSYMWWPGLDDNIEKLVKSCADRQAVKKSPPLQSWEWPSRVCCILTSMGPFRVPCSSWSSMPILNGHMLL